MSVNPSDHDLEELMREFGASDLTELHVRTEGLDLFLSKDAQARGPAASDTGAPPRAVAAPAAGGLAPASASAAPAAASSPSTTLPEGCVGIFAPYLGTFYRAPKPGEPNFVEIGDTIEAETDLCLVEVMKLFTAVRSEMGGTVRAIFAVDGQMVQDGQLLFAIEPKN